MAALTLKINKSKRTYTIRRYEGGKLIAKYRTFPQGKDFMAAENWTENDIREYLYSNQDYYVIK